MNLGKFKDPVLTVPCRLCSHIQYVVIYNEVVGSYVSFLHKFCQ